MKLIDSNVWLALTLSQHADHESARAWFSEQIEPGSIIFCRVTQPSLLRLLTTASVFAPFGDRPLRNTDAWSLYEKLRADQRISFAPGCNLSAGLIRRWRRVANDRPVCATGRSLRIAVATDL